MHSYNYSRFWSSRKENHECFKSRAERYAWYKIRTLALCTRADLLSGWLVYSCTILQYYLPIAKSKMCEQVKIQFFERQNSQDMVACASLDSDGNALQSILYHIACCCFLLLLLGRPNWGAVLTSRAVATMGHLPTFVYTYLFILWSHLRSLNVLVRLLYCVLYTTSR